MPPEPDYFEEARLGKAYDFRLLRRLAPFGRPHLRSLLWSIGLVVLITLLELSLPVLTQQAVDRYIVPAAAAPGRGPGGRLRPPPADRPLRPGRGGRPRPPPGWPRSTARPRTRPTRPWPPSPRTSSPGCAATTSPASRS